MWTWMVGLTSSHTVKESRLAMPIAVLLRDGFPILLDARVVSVHCWRGSPENKRQVQPKSVSHRVYHCYMYNKFTCASSKIQTLVLMSWSLRALLTHGCKWIRDFLTLTRHTQHSVLLSGKKKTKNEAYQLEWLLTIKGVANMRGVCPDWSKRLMEKYKLLISLSVWTLTLDLMVLVP